MRKTTGILVVALASGLAGCSSPSVSPTAPTSIVSLAIPPPVPPAIPPPVPPAPAGEQWDLTTTFTAITGPEVCASQFNLNLGHSSNWRLTVQRSGTSVQLAQYGVSDPSDAYQYSGNAQADEFSTAGNANSGALVCGGARFNFTEDDRVTGRFAADGQTLEAEEVDAYQLVSGELLSFHYEWKATRQ